MSLDHVMLGLLSIGPRTGYDLKKEIAGSDIFHWSGNSNQVYKSLLELSQTGLVENEVVHQEKGPTKKVFSLTALGRERLRTWLMSEIEPPEIRNPFLVRLLFADVLDHTETEKLILQYEERLRIEAKIAEQRCATDAGASGDSRRAAYAATSIAGLRAQLIETELVWLRKLRAGLPTA